MAAVAPAQSRTYSGSSKKWRMTGTGHRCFLLTNVYKMCIIKIYEGRNADEAKRLNKETGKCRI